MLKKVLVIFFVVVFWIFFIWYLKPYFFKSENYAANIEIKKTKEETTSNYSISLFEENFDNSFFVEEAPKAAMSKNSDWWVSSGAYFISKDGAGMTLYGDLDLSDKWFKAYKTANPRDTEDGSRPQNIFRLVLNKEFLNGSQQMIFQVLRYDLSASEYRNESNGVLFFNRYQDMNTLYYAGIRVDGQVVVRKKLNGKYSTLGISKFFSNTSHFDKKNNPNLIPLDQWIGIKSVIQDMPDGKVKIEVLVDKNNSGNWISALTVFDDGITYGSAIKKPGLGGIRTDFMDVKFDNFKVSIPSPSE